MSHSIYLRSTLARAIALGAVGGSVWGAGLVVADTSAADTGRAYELVSPADKGGQGVFFGPGAAKVGITRPSVDGNAAVYTSWGNFADAQGGLPMSYRARRTERGWVNEAVSPPPRGPDPDVPISFSHAPWEDAARDLSTGFALTTDPLDTSDVNGVYDVYQTGPRGEFDLVSRGNGAERATAAVGFAGQLGGRKGAVSADGAHAVFATDAHLVPEDAARAEGVDLYERFEGQTYLVNQTDAGGVPVNRCGSRLSTETERNAVSEDGSRIIFEAPSTTGIDPDCSLPTEIYMRVDRARTVHVTASQRTPADPSRAKVYKGASADGDRIFFTSSERLTNAATTGGLYRYTVSTGRLDQLVSGPLSLIRIVKISADGSHVYFASNQRFTPDATVSRPNLYYIDDTTVRLVVTDASNVGFNSGVASNFESARQANVTADGKHLVFVASGRLTDFDNLGRAEVYLFDAIESRLTCVSCDPAGQRPPGSEPVSDASIKWELDIADDTAPAITANGEMVVFDTSDQLVGGDTNRRRDVYEYRDGRLSLITTGREDSDAALVGMAGDGRDVFFATPATLLKADNDGGNVDLYDARVGGGFPDTTEQRPAPCSGDSCQGPPAAPPRIEPLGTESFAGDGQFNDSEAQEPRRRSLTVTRPTRAATERFAQSGRLRLTVQTVGGGRVQLRATSRVAGKQRVVARVSKSVTSSGRAVSQLRIRLSRSARRILAQRGRLQVRVEVRLAGLSQARVFTITLTRKNQA